MSTEPDLEAALAAAGLADATPGETVPGSLVIAGPDDLPDAPEPVRWPAGAATGVGSLPGTDVTEAAATVVGELPLLPHLPELPARGVGGDMIGRTAALLVDLAVEVVPSGWRVTARPGRDHRRAVDLLRFDVDALDAACAGPRPEWVKVQAAGGGRSRRRSSCTPAPSAHRPRRRAGVRRQSGRGPARPRRRGRRTDRCAGARPARRAEPAGGSRGNAADGVGLGNGAVGGQDAQDLLRDLVAGLGVPVVVHAPRQTRRWALARWEWRGSGSTPRCPCSADRPRSRRRWTRWARCGTRGPAAAGAGTGAADAAGPPGVGLVPRGRGTPRRGDPASADADGLGSDDLGAPSALRTLARRAFDLADRLGFDRSRLAELACPPDLGLAGATPEWARRAMTLSRELGRAFVDPPETW